MVVEVLCSTFIAQRKVNDMFFDKKFFVSIFILWIAIVALHANDSVNLLRFYENKNDIMLFGFMNKKGEVVIKTKYHDARDFKDGFAAVMHDSKWGFINTKGQVVVPLKYEDVRSFSDGMACVKKNNLFGFVNTKGKEVIPCKYKNTGNFNCGFTTVRGKYFIDKSDKKVFRNDFKWVSSFSNEYALVSDGKYESLVDTKGNCLKGLERYNVKSDVKNGFCVVALRDKDTATKGIVNISGRVVIDCIYDDIRLFSQGLAAFKLKGKWGFVNLNGKVAIKAEYEDVLDFSEGYAGVMKEDKWGFVDTSGKVMIDLVYYSVESFKEGVAGYCIHKDYIPHYGLINKKGKKAIKKEWILGSPVIENGVIVVRVPQMGSEGSWLYYDKAGKLIWDGEKVINSFEGRR